MGKNAKNKKYSFSRSLFYGVIIGLGIWILDCLFSKFNITNDLVLNILIFFVGPPMLASLFIESKLIVYLIICVYFISLIFIWFNINKRLILFILIFIIHVISVLIVIQNANLLNKGIAASFELLFRK